MSSLAKQCKFFNCYKKGELCLPNSWIVVRLDGKQFTRFTDIHGFVKPNDVRALELMNRAAACVMENFKDICLAFGQSDEYSFIFSKNTRILQRSRDSISTVINSLFSSAYVFYWNDYFAYTRLLYPPGFDCRVIVYPSDTNLRDYLCWRQADVHINNLYNTVFWALVKRGQLDRRKAQAVLRGTVSKDKNEILFKQFDINYNSEPIMFRKGTTLIRKLVPSTVDGKMRQCIIQLNCDIINDKFWRENYEILGLESAQVFQAPAGMITYQITECTAILERQQLD